MYVWYFLVARTGAIHVTRSEMPQLEYRPSESCWMVPNTVDPMTN